MEALQRKTGSFGKFATEFLAPTGALYVTMLMMLMLMLLREQLLERTHATAIVSAFNFQLFQPTNLETHPLPT